MKRLIGIVVVVVVAALGGWAWIRMLPMAAALPVVAESAMVDSGGYGIYVG